MARKVLIYLAAIVFALNNFPMSAQAESDATSKLTIKELIVKHSMEMGLDPALALSIAKTESGFSHNKKSPGGAVGVFQLMPSTAKKLGYNPYTVQDNIKGGIAYYKMMYKMFGSTELALAAYNAGPGNVKKYNGIPPFGETRRFVASIMNNYNNLKSNPDPAVVQYKESVKPINNTTPAEPAVEEYDPEEDFRMQQEAIIESFLAGQGI